MNAIKLTEEEWNKITVCNENGCLICGLGTSIKRVVTTEDEKLTEKWKLSADELTVTQKYIQKGKVKSDFETSILIRYCPMCGRKLKEE